MTIDTFVPKERAVLVGVTLPKTTETETEDSLAELARLAKTLGYDVVGTVTQKRGSLAGAVVLGAGKLKELAKYTGGTGVVERTSYAKKTKAAARQAAEAAEDDDQDDDDFEGDFDEDDFEGDDLDDVAEANDAEGSEHDEESEDGDDSAEDGEDEEDDEDFPEADVVVFDCELSPSQLSNLQKATGVDVFDRTGVIVEIFSRHARTRAAKLQVEIARLRYLAPRLRVTGSGPGDKMGKAGEKGLELDKRKIRDRIAELRHEIATIEKEQSTGRTSRSEQASIALVGYTNAGKSSMMRALTGSEVLVEDKLFATLDTTVRTLMPPSIPKVLVSDTVGFIKKLPTDLVASFHSTLEEAKNADHLLYVVDASDSSFRSQLDTTREVLTSIGAHELPGHLILNKMDKLSPEELAALQAEFPDAVAVTTKDAKSMAALREHIIGLFEDGMIDDEVFVPYTAHGAIGALRSRMRVLGERHSDEGTYFMVRAKRESVEKLRRQLGLD